MWIADAEEGFIAVGSWVGENIERDEDAMNACDTLDVVRNIICFQAEIKSAKGDVLTVVTTKGEVPYLQSIDD